MNKAIFLDRDGTINIDKGYTYKPEDLRFFPGVFEALRLLQTDFYLFIITNQSGIGRGMFTREDVDRFHIKMEESLQKENIFIKKIYICPHAPDENCNCRKPNTALIEQAIDQFDIDIGASYVIGDRKCDIELAKNAGAAGVLVRTGLGELESKEIDFADYVAKDILDAAGWINKRTCVNGEQL